MLVIATDEAGYGPKLGPLVIAASQWTWAANHDDPSLDESSIDDLIAAFDPLGVPVTIDGQTLRIDDSKAVYKAGSGLAKLHAVVSASHHWCGHSLTDVPTMLAHVAGQDAADISSMDWLSFLSSDPMTAKSKTATAIDQWSGSGIELSDVQARVITAKRFNALCESGLNKADLLSQATLGLVRDAVLSSEEEHICVFCDRHGGRRYYAGVIQQTFPEGTTTVVSESKTQSIYQCRWEGLSGKRTLRIAFTVKGYRVTRY